VIRFEFPLPGADGFSMSRHKRSGFPPWALVLILLLVGGGGYFAVRQNAGDASFRTTEDLDPALYYESANSLRGNTYRIDAEIDSSLGNSTAKGRLFSVTLKKPEGSNPPVILPVLIPPALGNLTIQKGQHYLMKVKVVEGGLLEVQHAIKP
jgi:hypothetical protein